MLRIETKNVLLMVTNVGSSSLQQISPEEKPFIDKAKCAMKLLVEKKLFLQPKDEIGIITMGDETTDNPEGIDFVKNYTDNLNLPNWEMLKYINNLNASNNSSNWVEGFHCALNFIEREVVFPDDRVFVVIFNNFKENEDDIVHFKAGLIVDDLIKVAQEIHLLFVGENPLNDKNWRKEHASYSEKFALKIMKEFNGQYEQINNFIDKRRFFFAPPVDAIPWEFDLEIAEISIPCSAYVKVNENLKFESWKMKAVDDTKDLLDTSKGDASGSLPTGNNAAKIVRENIKLDAQRNEVTADKIIHGYKFGGQYIPVAEEDEEAMKYEGGRKGMAIYGFVPQKDIKLEYWTGKGSRIIVPQSEEYASAFYSLVQAMAESKYVAIIRKVHANNYLPKMGVLFPRIADGEVWCLVHLELPYSDEVRFIEKKPIKSLNKKVTNEQVKALDDWIDAMTVPYEELPYLNPGAFPNIPHQYHWTAMAHRALNPEEPLPPLPEFLHQYMVPPEQLTIKAKPHLEKLDKLFGWNNEQILKKKQAIAAVAAAAKSSEEVSVAVTEKDKDVPSDKNTDEGFFFPDDIDMDTGELDMM